MTCAPILWNQYNCRVVRLTSSIIYKKKKLTIFFYQSLPLHTDTVHRHTAASREPGDPVNSPGGLAVFLLFPRPRAFNPILYCTAFIIDVFFLLFGLIKLDYWCRRRFGRASQNPTTTLSVHFSQYTIDNVVRIRNTVNNTDRVRIVIKE